MELIHKAEKIVNSCETIYQLKGAMHWCKLALLKRPDLEAWLTALIERKISQRGDKDSLECKALETLWFLITIDYRLTNKT